MGQCLKTINNCRRLCSFDGICSDGGEKHGQDNNKVILKKGLYYRALSKENQFGMKQSKSKVQHDLFPIRPETVFC